MMFADQTDQKKPDKVKAITLNMDLRSARNITKKDIGDKDNGNNI